MKQKTLQLDEGRRQVSVGDRTRVLPDKSWQVLTMLVANAPEVVARAEIIDIVWRGNFLVGEKGLNQAMWSIRAALEDDSARPSFIRTLPRVGYQWVYSDLRGRNRNVSPLRLGLIAKAAVLSVAALFLAVVALHVRDANVTGSASLSDSTEMIAISAYRVDEDIHVRFASGCLGIMRSSQNKEIGSPLLSEDGREVAVTVQESGKCRLVTIDVVSGELRDFGSCPVI